jgi:hypothetical protein
MRFLALARAICRETIQFFVLRLGGVGRAQRTRGSFGQTPNRSRYLCETHSSL